MKIIGENIHIMSPKVKEALANRDAKFFQESALKQVAAGAWAVDLNIGPQKKLGHEILPWLGRGRAGSRGCPTLPGHHQPGRDRGRVRDHQAPAASSTPPRPSRNAWRRCRSSPPNTTPG